MKTRVPTFASPPSSVEGAFPSSKMIYPIRQRLFSRFRTSVISPQSYAGGWHMSISCNVFFNRIYR
jgi:hypothetical protein